MKTCPECRGTGYIDCPVCDGTGQEPRWDGECTYCCGNREIRCNICGGTGELDDNDDYRA